MGNLLADGPGPPYRHSHQPLPHFQFSSASACQSSTCKQEQATCAHDEMRRWMDEDFWIWVVGRAWTSFYVLHVLPTLHCKGNKCVLGRHVLKKESTKLGLAESVPIITAAVSVNAAIMPLVRPHASSDRRWCGYVDVDRLQTHTSFFFLIQLVFCKR